MSEPNEKQITQDDIIANLIWWLGACQKTGCHTHCSEDARRRCRESEDAIRRVIEEHGEWKKRANQIMSFGKNENRRLLELEELARDIRDS